MERITYGTFSGTKGILPSMQFAVYMSCISTSVILSLSLSQLQVAALAPLALLLVLEARSAYFVIAHFNNIVCCCE